MKLYLILLLFISSFTLKGLSQSFHGHNFELYNGNLLEVNKYANKSGFQFTFYDDLKYLQEAFNKNVLYPEPNSAFTTSKDSLLNRIFLVEAILNKDSSKYDKATDKGKPIFLLKDTITSQILYFKYNPEKYMEFPFDVVIIKPKIKIDYCSRIEREVDDFTDQITLRTPYEKVEGGLHPARIIKVIANGKPIYYLSLKARGSTVNVGEVGVTILFDDGSKMVKSNEKIDVNVRSYGYEYSAFITLTSNELKTLSNKKISKFRLYIYDQSISEDVAENFTEYVKCITSAN